MKKHKRSVPKRAPKPPPVESVEEPPEEGLSVDSDELGPSFLRHATEQDNFESVRATPREFAPPVEPPSDDAPRESATSGNLWDRTVHKMAAEREPGGRR